MDGEEFNYKLHEIGRACGKIAHDIVDLHKNIGKILFLVPLRGGWLFGKAWHMVYTNN